MKKRAALLGHVVRSLLRAAPGACVVVVLTAVALAATPVASAWFLKMIFDAVGAASTRSALLLPIIGSCALAVATAVAMAAQRLFSARVCRAVRRLSQEELYARADSVRWLDELERPEFQNELRMAEQAGEQAPAQVLGSGITLVGGVLQSLGWIGSVIVVWPPALVMVGLVIVPYFWLAHRNAQRDGRLQERLVPSGRRRIFFRNLLVDPRAAKESRLFDAGGFLRRRIRELLAEDNRQEDRIDVIVSRDGMALAAVGGLTTALTTFIVAGNAITGHLSVGDFSLFLTAAVGAQMAITSASSGYSGLASAMIMYRHYAVFIDVDPALSRPAGGLERRLSGSVEFRNVWFRYDPTGPWVLKDVSFYLPPGAKIGIAGANGAGKSTLIKLICQLYEPTNGQILFDGIPAELLSPACVRSHITAVFQDFMTYDLTVAENLAIGNLAHLDDLPRLRAVAAQVDLDEHIMAMPHGYGTLLSRIFIPDDGEEEPTLLSGGQWQRLAIARAFLRDGARLAVLDEPTSGLDSFAQRRMRQLIEAVGLDRTVILVSHHLGSMRSMDVIYVLDQGAVVESGTHEELMAAASTYHELFSIQADAYAQPVGSLSTSR